MQERAKRRNYEDLTELSPWPDDQKSNFKTLQLGQKPRIKKMKSIPPRIKSISERKVIQRNSIKLTDYELPPVNRKSSRVKQQYSMTIQPPQGRLIRNISSHRLKSSESMGFIPEEDKKKFKLSGKKYDMVPVERSERMDDKDSRPYFNNNTMLLFSKKKDQILKRVLDQIQGRIKELRVYQ